MMNKIQTIVFRTMQKWCTINMWKKLDIHNSNFDQKKLGEEFECNERKLFRGFHMLFT
jgi:hypothetical protein